MRRLSILALLSFACLVAGCSAPQAPPHDVQPDPQAATPAQPGALRQAIQQPIDQAKEIRAQTEQSGTDQRQAIDDATGG